MQGTQLKLEIDPIKDSKGAGQPRHTFANRYEGNLNWYSGPQLSEPRQLDMQDPTQYELRLPVAVFMGLIIFEDRDLILSDVCRLFRVISASIAKDSKARAAVGTFVSPPLEYITRDWLHPAPRPEIPLDYGEGGSTCSYRVRTSLFQPP